MLCTRQYLCTSAIIVSYAYVAKTNEHLRARELRKQGMSIKDISKILNVSRGSASIWCRDVKLSQKQAKTLRDKDCGGAQG